MSENNNLSITNIKQTINGFVSSGVLDKRVIESLTYKDGLVQTECELWDYKKIPSGNSTDLAKTVLQVVSFHNTYGGYLIYGVEEIGNEKFLPVGFDSKHLDVKQLKDKLRYYVGEIIDITFNNIPVKIGAWSGDLGVIHIPKRYKDKAPVFFGRNGPVNAKGKLLFEKDNTYLRIQDNCEPATKKNQLTLLYSSRDMDFDHEGMFRINNSAPLFNNLPDRQLICARFIGRDKIIEQLWKWLGDYFSYSKLLAGDGGKGKTSIAYEFSEEICHSRPYNFERVIWLTGKRHQFKGETNTYVNIPNTNFSDLNSLLLSLSEELGIPEDEVIDASMSMLKKTISQYLKILPVFVVIDDVDSLELDEQKRVMETVSQLSSSASRFLLTTRMNVSYSSDACITVPGLKIRDYKELIKLYSKRFNISISSQEIELLHKTTDGSPMYTESLLRLVNVGVPLHKSIAEWKEEGGNDVRQAALMKELQLLSMESCRVLFALSLMLDASATELRKVTGYNISSFEQYINELSSLFLINSPSIIKTEKRYGISNGTALLVAQNPEKLIADPRVIEKQIKQLRNPKTLAAFSSKKKDIGRAINQAVVLLREDRAKEALQTIDVILLKQKNNRDLLFAKARCLCQLTPPSYNEARKIFRDAYGNGQRKELFFHYWYEAESKSNDPVGIVEVSSLAIDNSIADKFRWYTKRVLGYWEMALDRESAANILGAIDSLKQGGDDLRVLIQKCSGEKKVDAINAAVTFNDKCWDLSCSNDDWILSFDISIGAVRRGDIRIISYRRIFEAVENIVKNTETFTEKSINIVSQRIRELREVMNERSCNGDINEPLENIEKELLVLESKILKEISLIID